VSNLPNSHRYHPEDEAGQFFLEVSWNVRVYFQRNENETNWFFYLGKVEVKINSGCETMIRFCLEQNGLNFACGRNRELRHRELSQSFESIASCLIIGNHLLSFFIKRTSVLLRCDVPPNSLSLWSLTPFILLHVRSLILLKFIAHDWFRKGSVTEVLLLFHLNVSFDFFVFKSQSESINTKTIYKYIMVND
jgi:hypothetical protein